MATQKKRQPFTSWMANGIKRFLKLEQAIGEMVDAKLSTNDPVAVKKKIDPLNEFWVWYLGNADRLRNYYSQYGLGSHTAKSNYFYAASAYEDNKKTHSGLPKAIVDTLVNVTGVPSFSVNSANEEDALAKQLTEDIETIAMFNDIENIIKQTARPKTLVIGGGVFIVSAFNKIDPSLDKPMVEFVDERECDILTIGNVFVGVERRLTFTNGRDNFTLWEKRTYNKIENRLHNDTKNIWVSLTELDDTKHLEPVQILDIDMIPAVPLRYKNGYRSYGLSIFEGKLDLFDDLDQVNSQLAELVRKSSAVTFFSADLIETNKSGQKILPNTFDRKYIKTRSGANQEGKNEIKTDVPTVDALLTSLRDVGTYLTIQILTGVLSPSSLGIEIQRNSNAEAMREKEKVTLVTRDDIIDNERMALEHLLELCIRVYDSMRVQTIRKDSDIAVDYPDFSSPTFDVLVETLLPLWSADGISPEQFAKMLHTDTLTDEDLEKEIAYLTQSKRPSLDTEDIFPPEEDGKPQEEQPTEENSELK